MGAMETNLAAAAMTSAILIVSAAAWTNHTVGGDNGWFFDSISNTSSANYSAWASNQSFSLGDYLIFNTNTNQTVIQTYNLTTYRNCTLEFASDRDTYQYGGGGQNFGEKITVEVPLTVVGVNYFFSSGGGDDGVQCRHGMSFSVDVTRGAGLPPSLNHPPPPPYADPHGSDSGDSPPGSVVGDGEKKKNGASGRVGANVRHGIGALLLLLHLLFTGFGVFGCRF